MLVIVQNNKIKNLCLLLEPQEKQKDRVGGVQFFMLNQTVRIVTNELYLNNFRTEQHKI